MIDPDHLGFRKRPWNTSVSVPKKIESEETHEQKLLKVLILFMLDQARVHGPSYPQIQGAKDILGHRNQGRLHEMEC